MQTTENQSQFTSELPNVEDISKLCTEAGPSFQEYITTLPTEYIVVFSVLAFATLFTILNYLEELHYLYHHSSRWMSRDKAKWLLAVYPVRAFTAFVGLLAPRTSELNDMVSSMYVSVCVYVFVLMLIDQYGGPVSMFEELRRNTLRLNVPPLCCCCCLPKFRLNAVHLQVLHAMVVQFVITRPFLGYVVSIMWSDGTYGDENEAVTSPQTYISFVYTLSTLLAIYAFSIVFNQSKKVLAKFYVKPKYYSLQFVLLITGLQKSIITAIVMSGDVIRCIPPLSIEAVADRWHQMIVIGEMTVLSVIARIFYRELSQAQLGRQPTPIEHQQFSPKSSLQASERTEQDQTHQQQQQQQQQQHTSHSHNAGVIKEQLTTVTVQSDDAPDDSSAQPGQQRSLAGSSSPSSLSSYTPASASAATAADVRTPPSSRDLNHRSVVLDTRL